jgi:hypothetical protein
VLRLSNNNLASVPALEAALAPLAQLATLDLSGNLVQELPLSSITRLAALTHLWCVPAWECPPPARFPARPKEMWGEEGGAG